jgi:hypothetical protein
MIRVTKARITEQPKSLFDPMPQVWVTYEDAEEEEEMLFEYYPDETSFHPGEFVGLTRDQALRLRRQKDVAYLRS